MDDHIVPKIDALSSQVYVDHGCLHADLTEILATSQRNQTDHLFRHLTSFVSALPSRPHQQLARRKYPTKPVENSGRTPALRHHLLSCWHGRSFIHTSRSLGSSSISK